MFEGFPDFTFRRLNWFMDTLNGPMNHLSALLVHRKAKKALIKPLVFYRLFTIDSNNISLVDFLGKYFSP